MAHEANPQVNPETLPQPMHDSSLSRSSKDDEWRQEFPYPWDEDEVVTRRDTLRFLLAGSGALFVATGALAILGALPQSTNMKAVAGRTRRERVEGFQLPG